MVATIDPDAEPGTIVSVGSAFASDDEKLSFDFIFSGTGKIETFAEFTEYAPKPYQKQFVINIDSSKVTSSMYGKSYFFYVFLKDEL